MTSALFITLGLFGFFVGLIAYVSKPIDIVIEKGIVKIRKRILWKITLKEFSIGPNPEVRFFSQTRHTSSHKGSPAKTIVEYWLGIVSEEVAIPVTKNVQSITQEIHWLHYELTRFFAA